MSMSTTTPSPAAVSTHRRRKHPHVLLGVTGSVAAVKAPEIACRLIEECGAHVKVVLSEGGRNFWEKAHEYDAIHWQRLQDLLRVQQTRDTATSNGDAGAHQLQVIEAADEWNAWNRLGDPVLHIELRDWADVLLLAPLSAHSLAKLAHGLCDDTLSCVARAWDFGHYDKTDRCTSSNESNEPIVVARGKPVLLAPAMNTAMWEHPLTEQQLQTIQSFAPPASGNVMIVPPQSKLLACGEVGIGAMASVDTILQSVQSVLQ
jgi:phosphopantothenoylcysteine decarboxylase